MKIPSLCAVVALSITGALPAQLSISTDPSVQGLIRPGQPVPASSLPNLGAPIMPGAPTAPVLPNLGGPVLPTGPAMPTLLGSGGAQAPKGPSAASEQRMAELLQQMNQKLAAGELPEALKISMEALQLAETEYGPETLMTARRRMDVASVHRLMANGREAMEWGEKAVGLEQKVGDTSSLDYGLSVQRLGEIYLDCNEDLAASRAFQLSYDILKQTLPENDPAMVTALHNLGTAAYQTSSPEAKELLTKALALREEIHGKDSVPVAFTAGMLGRCYNRELDNDTAVKLAQRAVDILLKHEKQHIGMIYRVRDDIITWHISSAEIEKAEAVLKENEDWVRRTVGEDHPLFDRTFSRRAGIAEWRGQFDVAEKAYQTHLERVRKHQGPSGAGVLLALKQLAQFYADRGSTEKAATTYQEAVKVAELAAGTESGLAALLQEDLGKFYRDVLHDYTQAQACFRHALEIQQDKLGGPGSITAMFALAGLCSAGGKPEEARKLFTELEPRLGDGSEMETNLLASVRLELAKLSGTAESPEEIKKAMEANERMLRHAEEVVRRNPGNENPIVSPSLGLVSYLLPAGRAAEAEKLARRAWEISGRMGLKTGDVGRECLQELLWCLQDQKKTQEIKSLMREWQACEQERLEDMLAFATDTQRVRWLMDQWFYEVPASLGLARETALTLLRTKAIHCDIQMAARREAESASTPEGKPLADHIAELRATARGYQASLKPAAEQAAIRSQLVEAERQLAALSKAPSKTSVRKMLQFSLEDLSERLPADAAVLDFFAFCCRSPQGRWDNRYGVVVLRRGQEPKLHVSKHPREHLDELAGYFRAAMYQPGSKKQKDMAMESLQRAVYDMLLEPLEKDLAGVSQLYLCPDEQLQSVPFATLLDTKNRFLIERFRLNYLTSTRDLLNGESTATATPPREIAVFAAANYLLSPGTPARNAEVEEQSRFSNFLDERNAGIISPLPGTARELRLISQHAAATGWKTRIFQGDEASEPLLRSLPVPACLHVATHGFFLASKFEMEGQQARAKRKYHGRGPDHMIFVDRSMHRGGIFLAGAENNFALWRHGLTLPSDQDGIIFASEAGDLALRGTDLVFLSACDTGKGSSTATAGMVGLRSAFLQAGARNVITTLWPISDEPTADFVGDFYAKYLASGNAASALHETQRAWLLRVRKSHGLWQAVNQAGAFTLVSAASGVRE